MIEWFIPGNVPSKKNTKVWTSSRPVNSPAVKRWQNRSRLAWAEHKSSFREAIHGLPRPYFIYLIFIRDSDRLFDFTAPTETIMDEMVIQGYINDDNHYEVCPVFGRPRINKLEPGVIIRLIKMPIYEFY